MSPGCTDATQSASTSARATCSSRLSGSPNKASSPRCQSNWDGANEADLAAARDAYPPSDPKHPDYSQTMAGEFIEWAEQREKEKCMELEVLDHEDQIILFTGNPAERMQQMQETAAILAEPVRQRHTVTIRAGNTSVLKAGRCSAPCSASTRTSSGHGLC